jgi:hypothetical protein
MSPGVEAKCRFHNFYLMMPGAVTFGRSNSEEFILRNQMEILIRSHQP